MSITFKVTGRLESSSVVGVNLIQLIEDNWDDYTFKTSFVAIYHNALGEKLELGAVKIGFSDQLPGWTLNSMEKQFNSLEQGWFSLGQDVSYYKTIFESFTKDERDDYLGRMGDLVANKKFFEQVKSQKVLVDSLMRGVSLSVMNGQFRRVLEGRPALTEFEFRYVKEGCEERAAIDVDFNVIPDSKPSTNIHVLIGRNGVGKTTLLNDMVKTIVSGADISGGKFHLMNKWGFCSELPESYFSSVVSVSFSAFDPFVPPADQPDRTKGVGYFYLGMKKNRLHQKDLPPKNDGDLADDIIVSLKSCFSQAQKRNRWLSAIKQLESDSNFSDMQFGRLLDMEVDEALSHARKLVDRMSSGHSIVLLTISKLIDTVEEKTLVLMDEPESHLHPPLLSAFTRALSELLQDRNAVAIVATHSPVVLQEVPRSCVWKMIRIRTEGRTDRPERETFGENVGVLTREVFGLEVNKSGFHELLERAVEAGGTFDSIMADYSKQLGYEAQAILRTLVSNRDSLSEKVK
ncbi:MAG: AAA family ATPase [Pseudomonas sp.]|uniref:AAA family ATPase n=1 Tax=Pseudomonas sp. TaxID=306 RepID=UPI0023525133|nr:AAA family ATPase [Pseudomonas sp.]MBS5839547.1 AAA family ATPase [Pseudomonas sp.]